MYHGSTERGVIADEAGEHAFLPFGFLFLGRVPEKCFSLFFSLSLSPSPPYRVFGETILFFFISLVEDAQYLESFFLSSNSRVTSVSSFTLIFIIYI